MRKVLPSARRRWISTATTLIVSARATESLLLVTTYRDNEVSPTHPFMLAAKEQAKQGVQIHSIALRALGSPVKYTEYPGVGHNSGRLAYEEPELFRWLFAQRRGVPSEARPAAP